jgi:hypothetical protein
LIIALTRGVSPVKIWLDHFLFSAPSFLIAGLIPVAAIATLGNSNFLLAITLLTIAITYYCSLRFAERHQA